MNNSTKIAAFTMMDILTGMVIMSIIIAMVFYLFTALNQQVYQYGQIRNELNRFLLFRADLNRQMDLCESVQSIPNGWEIQQQDEKTIYTINTPYLLRTTQFITDTVCTTLADYKFDYLKDNKGEDTEIIRRIKLNVNIQSQTLFSYFTKQYSEMAQINIDLRNEL